MVSLRLTNQPVWCVWGSGSSYGLQFLRAALTFEEAEMDATVALLPPIHRAAKAAASQAGRRIGWFSAWGGNGSHAPPTLLIELVALRADVAAAGAEMICAFIGLFRMSTSG
jgi:hypothetical protein